MSEAENESKLNLEESSQLGAKAEGNDQVVSGAAGMSNLDAEDSMAHECKPNNEENDQGRIVIIAGEYQDSFEDMKSVVAVHGIYGDRKNTWMTEETNDQPRKSWLEELHEDNPSSRIMTFGYDASHNEVGLYTMGRIRDKALQLLDDLVELRRGKNLLPDTGRPLVFISHDLGGIIVKMALWIATLENSKYRDIKDWTWSLIFLGCPHRCRSTQDMEDKIVSFLRPCGIAYTIRGLGRSIIEINEAFFASKIPLITNILDVYAEEQGNSVEVFDKYMSTLDFPLERRLGCQRPHKDMCSIGLTSELYGRINQHICQAAYRSRASEESVKLLHTLRSLAAPVYPIRQLNDSETRFDWIAAHETYKAWFDSQEPSILHIHGAGDTTDASEFIFQRLNEHREAQQTKEILTYFAFKRHDDRYNSMMAMLTTLLIQMLSECQDTHSGAWLPVEEMFYHSSWTPTDLLLVFRNMLSTWDHGGILCVINGMSECEDSCRAFLLDICSLAKHTERRFKIAITSTSDFDLQPVLADWPTINLDSHREGVRSNLASEIDLEVLELVQQRSKFSEFEKTITEKLYNCGQDTDWRRLVLNQLTFAEGPPTKLGVEQQLEVLPPTTPKQVFVRILSGIPVDRRQWARKTLIWTVYSFHPLSIWELSAALMLPDESFCNETGDIGVVAYQDITGQLDKVFQGIFIVKHNEVHFSHPDAREFFLNVDCGQGNAWYDVRETAHQEITDACFFYLSILEVQKTIVARYVYPPADLLESPTHIPRYGFCSYAIKYWPRHYKLIPETSCPTESALGFCRNTRAMRVWAQAYWSLWTPARRTDSVFLSMLPILVGLELQDLATEWPDLKPQPDIMKDCAVALAEAARHANIDAVRTLLSINGYSQSDLEDVLSAASSCCDGAVLDLLITNIAENSDAFQWPPVLLCRAAQFGLKTIVRKLLKFGASLEAAVTLHKMTPLHLAARHGHAKVVKVLLEEGAKHTAQNELGWTPLHYASKYSHATVLSLLLDGYADCHVVDSYNKTALDIACENGIHVAVRMLLMNPGCDTGCDRQGISSPLSVATNNGFFSCAKLLLDKDAKTEVQGNGGRTPLYDAALNGHSELCRLLLKHGAKPNVSTEEGPILFKVAIDGDLEIVKILVENGAEIDATNSEDRTALQGASNNGHKAVVAYLLENGADVHHGIEHGSTAVHLAASYGFSEIVQLLIDSGADLKRPSPRGWTPLHLCYDHPETTQLLLKNGADVDSVTESGLTPLLLAASNNYPEVVKALLPYNPDLEITITDDPEGFNGSVLTAAVTSGSAEVTRLLLEAGVNIDRQDQHNNVPLHFAAIQNQEDVLRILMEYNPKLNLVDDEGDTALNCINFDTSITIVKILVNGGADCNIRNKMGNTPICSAALSQNIDVLKYLAKKAAIDVVGGVRGGPLHIACYLCNLHLVKFLVDVGADVNLLDPFVGTPLQSACRCGKSSEEEQDSIILYLINEAHVDPEITGGLYGCSINAACGRSSSEIVKLMLQKGASIEVKDKMGRMAIHFAAARSKENFQVILESGADVEVADKMGRTALHWASVGGIVQVIDRIISMSRGLVDQGDLNGWTPLLWAARGSSTQQRTVSASEQEEVIKLLLKSGANPCVRTKGLDQNWSPVKVARYHGAHERVIRLLEEKAKEKLKDTKGGDLWDEKYHASRTAARSDAACDCCFSFIDGKRYHCQTCLNFDLCYTCYLSREVIHLSDNPNHHFVPIGPEYQTDSEQSEPADSESVLLDTEDEEEEEEEEEEKEEEIVTNRTSSI